MKYIERQLKSAILPFLARREALAIVGPRQAGKTTFIKHLEEGLRAQGKRVWFITFERRTDLDLFQNSIEDFKQLTAQYDCVIIDEFQYAAEGGQKLKYLYDTTPVKFIISGSSSLELTFQTGKYMVGRLLEFRLLPFSFREYLQATDAELYTLVTDRIGPVSPVAFNTADSFGADINRRLAAALERYSISGGYPAAVLAATNAERQKILEGIVEKYILYDIKGLLQLPAADSLLTVAKLLAGQIGNVITFSELANSSRLTYPEIKRLAHILQKTFIVSLVKPFFTNRRQEVIKSPKVYFIDLGVRNFLLNDFRLHAARPDTGALMENYAWMLLQSLAGTAEIKYWRTKAKAEVDFVLEHEQRHTPIEIKYGAGRAVGKSFYSFIDKYRPPTGIILTREYAGEEKIKDTLVKFIPLCYF